MLADAAAVSAAMLLSTGCNNAGRHREAHNLESMSKIGNFAAFCLWVPSLVHVAQRTDAEGNAILRSSCQRKCMSAPG